MSGDSGVEVRDTRRRIRKLDTRDGVTLDQLRAFVEACEGIPGRTGVQTPGGGLLAWVPLRRIMVVEERPE